MNNIEGDILKILRKKEYVNQRQLAEESGYSLGTINSSLKKMVEEGMIDSQMNLTGQAWEFLKEKKTRRAVILAAGAGMRMVPINVEVSKGLLEVKGETLVERLIKQLHEANVTEIRIVVGFMKEQYEYLIDKYNVELIYNPHFKDRNNLYSLALTEAYLSDSYIIPCDIWCRENPFDEYETYSWYMLTDESDEESNVRINRRREIRQTEESGNRMIGIAYISSDESTVLKKQLREKKENRKYHQSYWESAAFFKDKMLFSPKEMKGTEVYEINTLEELRELDQNSNQLNSDVLEIITSTLECGLKDITEIEALKKGMTNRSFRFRCGEKRYIMRIPGEGSENIIDRAHEYSVYQEIGRENICDPVIYMEPKNGYKITEYLENTRTCDCGSAEDVKRCMDYLRAFHEKGLKVGHTFNLFEQIEKYESYWNGEKSVYRDYFETKEKIYELKQYIDQQDKRFVLTHIDAVPDNFLFANGRIYLIDWEYAGMQDPHVDIAMFAIYAMYGREQVEHLIDSYFDGKCPENVRTKIYCYIAVCGFLWSNWCEYKRICGVEFGEYSLRQYRYAKDYYKIAKERIEGEQ